MQNRNLKSPIFYIASVLLLITAFQLLMNTLNSSPIKEITSSEFMTQLQEGRYSEIEVQIGSGAYNIRGQYKETPVKEETTDFKRIFQGSKRPRRFETKVLGNDSTLAQVSKLAEKSNTKLKTLPESGVGIWISLIPYLLLLVPLFFLMRTMQMGPGGGRGVMNFGKTKSRDISKQKVKVRFSDVAGAEEEKQELVEVVEFLKDPKRFTDLGARIPAGVLLEGPPGTGKTLLAKAVAGEAGVPFFSISGSEFVEMFVGVGASRVRDLFENAKKNAPAIVFIDEIDAVGRRRGAGVGGGNDEREQTLNQLLVEMDGFEDNEGGVIVIAATNRSDVLDPALLRPGRFDRKIMVGNPDVKAREEILGVHAKGKPLATEVDLRVVAQQTPGFSGADLANLLNEAALIAARLGKTIIDMTDVNEAQDRIIAGLAKRGRERTEKANRIVAYHEAGHAIAGLVLESAQDVHKVTIVPRGRAAGYVISLPKEDQVVSTKDELFNQVVGLLAGRAAEEIVFNEVSSGAANDFEQASSIVRTMIMKLGMSEGLGMVDYGVESVPGAGFQKLYSDQLAYEIDREVIKIMNAAYKKACDILNENRDKLNLIAEKLIELETIDGPAIKALFETGEMPPQGAIELPQETPESETEEEDKPSSIVEDALEAGERIIAEDDTNHHA
ncbi:ATP-dependent zinc metalloprotease FtsH [Aerococcaceae bacterium NML191219]|nr:ATP-dependent zinc metalloprotease FtsH [Aerococcaceae bacterium NML191219]